MGAKNKNYVRVAAALRYNVGEDNAPKIVAAGRGAMAKKIVDIANQKDIPIHRDKVLAQTLTELGVGVEIPPELYQAVAKILIQVARLDKKLEND
ncbi:EscU/YscU/HrcU family type III secretion system export apparatus switch protein [Peptococcaceae bacterium 1198_IL3148]